MTKKKEAGGYKKMNIRMIFEREMDGKEKDNVWVITVLQSPYFRVL